MTNDETNKLTGIIISCAMEVHRILGSGFHEAIYQRSLSIELALSGLIFERDKPMPIFYRKSQIGTRRIDFFVEGAVMVELKAVDKLENIKKTETINYCEAYNISDGLLLNFGNTNLEFKRVYNKNLNVITGI